LRRERRTRPPSFISLPLGMWKQSLQQGSAMVGAVSQQVSSGPQILLSFFIN
jgi:hypothetical protein